MGINVRIEHSDRSVATTQVLLDASGHVARVVRRAWAIGREEYPFTTCIDPYGDTLMNYLMTPMLLAELRRMIASGGEGADVLKEIERLGDYVVEHPSSRLFLAFIGD